MMSAEPTLLDRAIGWLAPKWAYRRLAARHAYRTVQAYYDGADTGRRGASIRRKTGDANAVSQRSLPNLRYGARDLVRNNPHARRGVEAIVSNTVGIGIAPQFLRDNRRAEEIEALADAHLETTECDTEGRNTYAGLQALAMETIATSGEVLIRRRFRRSADPITVPLQFQVLEPDYLDEARDGPTDRGGYIVQGVEYDRIGRIRGYWLRKEHPGSSRIGNYPSDFVSALEVAHIFRTDRPGQARGIPWLAPIMLRIQDFADYEEAHLVRQKIAAAFTGWIQETFDRTLGAPPGAETDDDDNIIDTLQPGTIERLPPGTEIKFGDPPGVEGYAEYSNVSLHAIAAGLGVSYEAMSGDLRGVNFSSGKMGRLEFQRNIDRWQRLMLIPQLCAPLMGWWLEAVELSGQSTEGVKVRHVPPQQGMVDPTREGPADIAEIAGGTKTLFQVLRERGRDPVEHLEEWAEGAELMEELGISLTSMAGAAAAQGGAQALSPAEADRIIEALEERGFARNGVGR